jgi:hypothetical protein
MIMILMNREHATAVDVLFRKILMKKI